jgi:hypothetical protein
MHLQFYLHFNDTNERPYATNLLNVLSHWSSITCLHFHKTNGRQTWEKNCSYPHICALASCLNTNGRQTWKKKCSYPHIVRLQIDFDD